MLKINYTLTLRKIQCIFLEILICIYLGLCDNSIEVKVYLVIYFVYSFRSSVSLIENFKFITSEYQYILSIRILLF